ncbi:hypothetical protein ACQJBY_029538 [Aegilops geniculata]
MDHDSQGPPPRRPAPTSPIHGAPPSSPLRCPSPASLTDAVRNKELPFSAPASLPDAVRINGLGSSAPASLPDVVRTNDGPSSTSASLLDAVRTSDPLPLPSTAHTGWKELRRRPWRQGRHRRPQSCWFLFLIGQTCHLIS